MKDILQKSFTFLIISILLLITFLPKGLSQVTKTAIVISTLPDVTVTVTAPPPVAEPTDTSIPGPGPAAPGEPAPQPGTPQQPGAPQPGAPQPGTPQQPGAPQPGGPGITPSPGAPQPSNNVPSPGGTPNNSPTDSTGSASSSQTDSITNILTGHIPVPSIRPDNGGSILKWNLIDYSVVIGGLIMGILILSL
ncbi:hypothetical protein RclHR1_00070063 [Rhizophagus clarus]|uniref:Translation initiation factor IF-2 n=1 Tax=Rhizophagus clarus TaxID=94130 RepID=A0A2Z6RUI7_9GLOM|nr:hypothetical protein RclHR1_00070063 [Rhizophagus clarus]GES74364.1 translation initiation factor IF-2 [Rhizophagus clarus]